jgi:bacterioferritin (cytochrome b1)
MEKKMPRFVEFAKNVPLEYIEKEKKAEFDYSEYEKMFEDGLISKKEFEEIVSKEEERQLEEDKRSVEAIKTKSGYVLRTKQPVYVEAVLHTTAQLYFGVDAKTWEKIQPLFQAILERNLDMNDENVKVYIDLLSYIETDPLYTADRIIVDKIRRLDEFKNVKDIRDVIGDVPLDKENLSKALIEFLNRHIEIVSEGKGEEFKRSKEILKAVLSLV